MIRIFISLTVLFSISFSSFHTKILYERNKWKIDRLMGGDREEEGVRDREESAVDGLLGGRISLFCGDCCYAACPLVIT